MNAAYQLLCVGFFSSDHILESISIYSKNIKCARIKSGRRAGWTSNTQLSRMVMHVTWMWSMAEGGDVYFAVYSLTLDVHVTVRVVLDIRQYFIFFIAEQNP
jgi:hypothetical protein